MRAVHQFEVFVLLLDHVELVRQELHAIVGLLFECAVCAHEGTGGAFEDDRGTLVLVRKQLFVRQHFSAALLVVAALKHQLAQQISGHAVHSVELTLLSTEWTGVGVVLEPVVLAVAAQRLLALLALDWVLQHVVADATNELLEECLHLHGVRDFLLFVYVLLVLLSLINYTFHSFNK